MPAGGEVMGGDGDSDFATVLVGCDQISSASFSASFPARSVAASS